MIVKTFTAPTLEKALWLLNEDLGPKAVVLKTRFNNNKNKPGKPLQFVEVTAFLDSTLHGARDGDQPESTISINSSFPNIQSKTFYNISSKFDTAVDVEILEVVGW